MFVNFRGFLFPNCMFTYFALFLKIRFALFFLIFRNPKCWSVIKFRHCKYLLFRFSNFVRSVFSLNRNPPLGINKLIFVCVCMVCAFESLHKTLFIWSLSSPALVPGIQRWVPFSLPLRDNESIIWGYAIQQSESSVPHLLNLRFLTSLNQWRPKKCFDSIF